MFSVEVVLEVGVMKDGDFQNVDDYTFEIFTFDYPDQCDNVNDILSGHTKDASNYARLRMFVTGQPFGFLISSFKRVKLKNGNVRWTVE